MITIKLDNTNIYSAINVKVNKSSKLLDKIVENRATIDIDNTLQDFVYNVTEKKLKFNGENVIDKEVVITIDGVKQFTGLIEKYEYDIAKQTVKIICKDKWKKSRDTKAEEKYYFEKSFDFILKDLLGQIGITDFSNIYEITDTIQYFYTNGEVEVADEIEKLMTAVGGYIYFDEDGIISFDGGFYPYKSAPIDTTTKATFYPDEYANLNLKNPSETGKIRVEAKTFKQKDELVPIYTQKNMQIPTNPYPESPEELFAEFDNPVFFVQSLNDISFYSNTGVSLDSTVYNSNFADGNIPKNPKKFKLSFLGGGTGEVIDYMVIKGKIFEEETYISERGSGKQKEFKTEVAQNDEWVNFLTNWYYDNIVAQNSELTLELSDFRQLSANGGLRLKDKVVIVNPENNIQNRYVIDEMDISYETSKIKLTLRIDLDSYVDVALPKKLQVPTLPQLDLDIEEIKKLFQNKAPAVPSWGSYVLSTLFYNGKSYVTAEWDANTEEYFKNYEVYRSYDNINFDFIGSTNITKFSMEVPPKTNVYIKLKSVSYDDLKSDFSSVKSIESAFGETMDDDPVAITSYAGFGYIWLKWTKSNDDNYAGTVIQRQTNDGSYVGLATILDNTYMDTNITGGNTYRYKIYFVNKFGINGTAIYSSTITAKDKIDKVDIDNFVVENTDFASGIQPIQVVDTLPTLPDTSFPNSSIVILTTDNKIYRNNNGTWKKEIDKTDIENFEINFDDFESGLMPTRSVSSLPALPNSNYPVGCIVYLTTDGKIYRNENGTWKKEIDKTDIENFEINFDDFESGLMPTRSVSSLPALPNSNYPVGCIVYLTTDGKIYRNENGTWKKNVDTTDLTGQIQNAQIALNAIKAPQIDSNAVTEAKIATDAITETKISDDAVTATKIVAGAIQAGHITTGAVTTDKIASDAVDANKIAAGSIDASHINASKINAGDIIAAGTISADEIASNAITAVKINANAITTDKIATGAVTADEIATNAITADKILAEAISSDKIAAGAITTSKLNVLARNLVNNFSVTGTLEGWAGYGDATIDNVTKDGKTVKALKSTTTGSVQIISERFEVDPTQTYRVDLSILGDPSDGATGTRWFGLYAYDKDNTRILVTQWSVSSKSFGGAPTYPYFWWGDIPAGTWRDMTAYILGCNVEADEVPEGKNVSYLYKLPPNAVRCQIRFLNYYNDGIAITNWFFSPSVTKVDTGVINSNRIVAGAITSDKIAANTITAGNIATGAISATELATGAVTADKIGAGAITADKIGVEAVTADKIATNAITAGNIASGAITSDKIAANTITAGNIASGAISTDELAAGAITADKIGVEEVTADKIATNAITASKIAAESISADKLSSLELTGSKYIQAGDANQGYRIDATDGLIRLLDTQQYPIPSIMHQGEANLGTSTETTITLSPSMTDINYEVILNMKSYKYWDSEMDINQPRYMNLYVKDKTLTSFKIVAETLYAQALIVLNNDYNILSEINSGNFHNKYSVANMIGYTTEFLGIQKTNSVSNYTGYISSRIDYDLEQNDYSNLGKKTFTLKTNPGDFWTTKTYTAGSYETNPDTDPPDGNYGIVDIRTLSYGENDIGHQIEFSGSGIYFVGSLRAGDPSLFPAPSTQPQCTYTYGESDLIDMFQTCVYMNENYGGGKIKFIYDYIYPYSVYVIYKFYTPSGSLIFTKKYGTYGHIAFVASGGYNYFRLYVYFKTGLSLPSNLEFTLKSTEHPEVTTSANAIVNYTVIGK
jgi:hypothetical protein